MKKFIYLPVACVLLLSACSSDYKKAGEGMEYKIIADGSGPTLKVGEFVQVQVSMEYKDKSKDTLLSDTRDMMPQIVQYDSTRIPPATFKILKLLRKGDSLVMRILTDSAYRPGMQPMEPFMRKGGFLYTKVRVLNIFKTTEEADSANLAEMKKSRPLLKKKELAEFNKKWADMETNLAAQQEQTAKDSKIIEDYLAKNNIKATRTKWGTYVAIHTEGTGDPVTSESIVKVNYTGKTLDSSKVFDSNTDPKFNHVEPYQLSVGQSIGSVVPGWTDALLQLKNGTKATIYLPSALGYGKGGRAPSIKPDEILVFEMDVIDVQTEDQLMAQAEAERAKLKEREKAVQDSLKRTK